MKIVHIITSADVGDGVYRHSFRSKMRSLLVEIKDKFGGIGPKDVGVKVYRAGDGQLVWGRILEYTKRKKNPPRRRTRASTKKSTRRMASRPQWPRFDGPVKEADAP